MEVVIKSLEEIWAQPVAFRSDYLKDQVALVSGGGTGIGKVTAMLLARLGAKVAICGRKLEKLEPVTAFAKEHGAVIASYLCDIRKPDDISAMHEKIDAELGPIDLLVNNAGGQFPQAAIDFSVRARAASMTQRMASVWRRVERTSTGTW